MSEIFVTGHRNPDTDAIVAAISYTNLRHSIGDSEYVAARIGSVNDETQKLLDRFGFEAPVRIRDMRTQIRDLDFDRPPVLSTSVTIDTAWKLMMDDNLDALPIKNDDGTLHGMLSKGDIYLYDMGSINDNSVEHVAMFNLLSVLEGSFVNEFAVQVNPVSGVVNLALPQTYTEADQSGEQCILICGNQPDVVDDAIARKVGCIIICRGALKREWQECSTSTIISTPLSARRVSRIIYHATTVDRICCTENIVSFHLDDYVDDVKEIMLQSRFRSYPVLDENDVVVGTISRYHLLRPNRKRVVLVDHNEAAQSVQGLDQVEILEIIDHHRLADIQTTGPIRMRNEPVGSTNTIIATMYQENGVLPSPAMAGLMAGAILSDTVLFKSPTCTKRDISMAERLAKVAGVSLDDLGRSLFSADISKDPLDLFKTDYKEFHISGHDIAVSQITCDASEEFLKRKPEFLDVMESRRKDKDFDMVLLMITDVLLEGTYLLYTGADKVISDEIIHQAFSIEPKDNCVFLPDIMSRKKQIIPMLTALWG